MKNKDLIIKDNKIIANCSRASYFPLVIKKANGIYVEDLDGNKYIDMISSACVMNTGYNHDKIIEAVKRQIDQYIHFSNDYFYSEPQVKLGEKLIEKTPGKFRKKVIFGFSGSDAIDSAIKASRSYTKRSKIISFIGAYHGSTYGAISISGIDTNMVSGIGPLLPEVYHLPYPDIREMKDNEREEEFGIRKFNEFIRNFNYYIPKDEVAAIFIEPIAGDLGLIKAPESFVKNLRDFCTDNDILFIVDEIQQGFGRTGKWFCIEHFDVIPDLVVTGKAMGSGLPISAVVGREEVIDSLKIPAQLFTLQGNAVCAISAYKTIEIIDDENLLKNAELIGKYIVLRFLEIKKKSSIIKTVRGYGLSIGVELEDKYKKISSVNIVKKICYRCFEKGIILIYLAGKTLRIQPPLIINEKEAKIAMDIIEEVFSEYEKGKISDEVLNKIQGW